MPDRPYASILNSDLQQMISACIESKDRQRLLKIQIELRHRKSASAKRLKAQVQMHLKPVDAQSRKNLEKSKPTRPRLGPDGKPIFELERLAEAAMQQDLVTEVQDIASRLAHRSGHRVNNLKNRITIYLWEQGLKPDLLRHF